MAKQRNQSKWQKASAQITNLKWEIEHVLAEFTEEEKQSEKYTQLLETLDLLIDHILHKYKESALIELQKENEELKKKSSTWMSWKILAAAIVGGLATEVAKYLIKLLSLILGGDQP